MVFIFILPLLGALIYLVVRGGSMNERDLKRAQDQQKAIEDYIRSPPL